MTDVPSFPTGKLTVSFTELSGWAQCTWRHKLKFIDGIGEWEDSPYNIFGSAVHESCAVYLKTRKIDLQVAYDYLNEHWSDQVENARFYNRGVKRAKELRPKEWWIELVGKIMADVPDFLDTQFPGWKFISAEERLNEPIEGHRLNFKGFIDGVLAVPNKRGQIKYWVIDWKTAGWGWPLRKKRDFMVQLQLMLYKIFWSQKADIPLKDVRCAFVLLKRDDKVKPGERCELLPISLGPTTRQRSLAVIDDFVATVEHGIALKNRNSCLFCDFKDTEHCLPYRPRSYVNPG